MPRRKKGQTAAAPAAAEEVPAVSEAAAEAADDGGASARYPQVARLTGHAKKRILVLCSRGVTSAFITLMEDLLKLLPHARKDPKFDKREALSTINEIASLSGCHYALYFEARKMRDLYLWASSTAAGGPSVKFLVQQLRPMSDPRLTGNCLLGSRPILSFGAAFSSAPHLRLLRQLLTDIFAVPRGHRRSKPFHDHVMQFALCDGRVIVRHYQVVPPLNDVSGASETLVEIGPRFALVPIRVLDGSFSGKTIYANAQCAPPHIQSAPRHIRRRASFCRSSTDR